MQTRRIAACWMVFCAVAPLAAQTPATVPHQLSLAQALELARQNNPTYLQARTAADPAAEAVKAANWARLPSLSANGGVGYTGAGSQFFGGQVFASSPTVQSNYGLGATLLISTRTFLTPAIDRAQERATDQNISAAGVTLVSNVTSQYLNVLRAGATVNVAIQQVAADSVLLLLARAKQQVGQNSLIDVLLAQTQMATAQVQLLQTRQAASQAKIALIQTLGLPADADPDALTLSEPYALVQPNFDLAALRDMARISNPAVRALMEQDRANRLSVRAARLDRLPTMSISAGLSGYTQQFTNEGILLSSRLQSAQAAEANCSFQNQILLGLTSPIPGGIIPDCKAYAGLDPSGLALQPGITQQIHAGNSAFPFNFTGNPLSVNLNISLPIWDGYSRSLRISQAEATEDAGRQSVRAQQLAADAQIQTQLLAVNTAWQRTVIQDTNRVTARQQLQLAQDRYRIGSGTALDVANAQTAVTQSEADYITAVFDYHLAVVALENAVGRPLR